MCQIGDSGASLQWTESESTTVLHEKKHKLTHRSIDRATYRDESRLFFDSPLASFIEHMEAYAIKYGHTGIDRPSHVIAFDRVLNMGETQMSKGGLIIKDTLRSMGYREVWYGKTLIDSFHPEIHSRGGLRVWSTDTIVKPIVEMIPS